jgi:MYXO-CTERM domain-containing protein
MRAVALLTAAALGLLVPAAARADGDPASDILPQADVYYPYSPQPSPALTKTLDELLADVRQRGFPVKVALIATAADLGAYPTMFNQAQVYANLLTAQLPQNPHGTVKDKLHLLVVMPAGFGGSGLGAKVDDALSGVEVDPDGGSDALVRAAIEAVANLASANGVETPVPDIPAVDQPGEDDGGGGGAGTAGIVIAVLALLGLGAAILVVRRRRGGSDERPPEPPEAQGDGEDARSQ